MALAGSAATFILSLQLVRNKVKYAYFRKLRHNTNPNRGPFQSLFH